MDHPAQEGQFRLLLVCLQQLLEVQSQSLVVQVALHPELEEA
jgi:hypothetical protein